MITGLRAVVINLDRRPDRLTAFTTAWQAAGADLDVHRVPGVDDRLDPVAGCWASHLHALDLALANGDTGPLLVLEDDAVFAPGFTLDLRPPADWQLLRLGGALRIGRVGPPGWAHVHRAGHTHAYITRHPEQLRGRIAGYRVADVSKALAGPSAGHYRLLPATVGQAAGPSDIGRYTRPADTYWN